jgi:hypothetical protein
VLIEFLLLHFFDFLWSILSFPNLQPLLLVVHEAPFSVLSILPILILLLGLVEGFVCLLEFRIPLFLTHLRPIFSFFFFFFYLSLSIALLFVFNVFGDLASKASLSNISSLAEFLVVFIAK